MHCVSGNLLCYALHSMLFNGFFHGRSDFVNNKLRRKCFSRNIRKVRRSFFRKMTTMATFDSNLIFVALMAQIFMPPDIFFLMVAIQTWFTIYPVLVSFAIYNIEVTYLRCLSCTFFPSFFHKRFHHCTFVFTGR